MTSRIILVKCLMKARKMSCLVFQGSSARNRGLLVPHFLGADARDEVHSLLL